MSGSEPEVRYRVALHVIAMLVAARAIRENAADMWGLYPDIGEHDWARIVERALVAVPTAGPGMEVMAYKLLGELASLEEFT